MTTAGRPRAFDTDVVLDKALELFWKNGYRVTTTRELEEGLGLNASSIYNAFGSKEALLVATMDRYELRITSFLLDPLERSEDGLDALDGFFAALGEWITHDGRRGCMLVNMMAEDGGETSTISKRVGRYRARLRAALLGALNRAAYAGEIPPEEVGSRADLLLCQVFGLNIAARSGIQSKELCGLASSARRQIQLWKEGR